MCMCVDVRFIWLLVTSGTVLACEWVFCEALIKLLQ